MAKYSKPDKHLHREFLYLNHDTVFNSLSALEAGKVDEIIQKSIEAREGGFGAALGTGGASISGSRKKTANVEEELVRTRTVFSAFDAWYTYLDSAKAIGTFDGWDLSVRNEVSVGDTIEFSADLSLTSLHLVFRTLIAYADRAANSASIFAETGEELKATKRMAVVMREMLGGEDEAQEFLVRMAPSGVLEPAIYGRMDDQYFVTTREAIEGTYRVVAQVDRMLDGDETVSAIRVLRGVPATRLEIETVEQAVSGFAESTESLGVKVTPADIRLKPPSVLVRPIAVWR